MSSLYQDPETQQYRVYLPSCKKLPPNPHIGGGFAALQRTCAPPSDTENTNSEISSELQIDKGLRYDLLASDQRSFFTGSAAADLEAAHILNPVRGNLDRKQWVQVYLTQQKLHPPMASGFELDTSMNVILLEASLHTQWDLYGTFCFVPGEEDAKAMLQALRISNELWNATQQRSSGRPVPKAARPLNTADPPFAKPKWDILLLHPNALLPEQQPIAIADHRPLYSVESSQVPNPPNWSLFVAYHDRLRSLYSPYEYLPPFLAANLRDDLSLLSSLAMVINAHSKLMQFMQSHGELATDRVKLFAKLMSDLVKEIFFVPRDGFDNVATPAISQPAQALRSTSRDILPASAPPVLPSLLPSYPSYPHIVDSTPDSMMEPIEDGLFDEAETPEEAGVDGLTDSEFELLESKANDSRLDPEERADAAMLMIFGSRTYTEPHNHSQVMRSGQD